MLFSILIANYNNGHFFNDCYQSIISQTYSNWEVIIVDDCSSDDSMKVIKNIIGDDNRFKIFENNLNKGCGYTKNKCAALANGELLGFLDPDDALNSNALDVMVEAHKKQLNVTIITSKFELVDLNMNFIRVGMQGESIPINKSYLTFGKGALTAFAVFKKSCYTKTKGIDKQMKRAVDQDLYYKMEEQGKHLFLDKVLYKYRIHQNNISINENLYKAHYWHFYAILKAFKRRKKLNLSIDNFENNYIKQYKSNYYLGRFQRIKKEKKIRAKFYFLIKSLFANPFHKFEVKVKSLIKLIIGRT